VWQPSSKTPAAWQPTVHLSSDRFFSGTARELCRNRPVDPVTVYGKTMAEAEVVLREAYAEAAILRISLADGPSFNKHAVPSTGSNRVSAHGRPATLYFDEVRSCTYTDDLNEVFARFLPVNKRACTTAAVLATHALSNRQIVNRVAA